MNKTKKFLAMICAVSCAVSVGGTFVACKDGADVDETKTQLYIGNYDGGMGSRWLDEYKKGFESLYSGESFEKNKTGVQVIIHNDKGIYGSSSIDSGSTLTQSDINLIFSENVDYYKLVEKGWIEDISDVVTSTAEGETATIESKLNDSLKKYYQCDDGKYYGLPHYRSFRGLTYDMDLFNSWSLYRKQNGSISGKQMDVDLTAGPDGDITTTYDNGLPATYEEFFELCDRIQTYGGVPVCWTGTYRNTYTNHLLQSLFVNAQGFEQSKAFYNPSTTATDFKTISSFDGSGTPQYATTAISRNNYKEFAKLSGIYHAVDFLGKIISNNYYFRDSLNDTESHEMTHYHYLHSKFDPNAAPIAMMIEGTWWEEEANLIFEDMAKNDETASRTNRNFGFMPLPKVDSTQTGAPILYDGNKSIVMVTSNSSTAQKDLAKKFIKYISSDDNLRLFHTLTGMGRDYNYVLGEENYNKLSSFGKSIQGLVEKNGGIVYGYPLSKETQTWVKFYDYNIFSSKVGITTYTAPIFGLVENVSAVEYFLGISKQF